MYQFSTAIVSVFFKFSKLIHEVLKHRLVLFFIYENRYRLRAFIGLQSFIFHTFHYISHHLPFCYSNCFTVRQFRAGGSTHTVLLRHTLCFVFIITFILYFTFNYCIIFIMYVSIHFLGDTHVSVYLSFCYS